MMLELEVAAEMVLSRCPILGGEELSLREAWGRVLAEDIRAHFDLPPFHKSAMDGYALRAGDLTDIPRELRCVGVVKPGEPFNMVVKQGECVQIMTGAPLPPGVDSVVMVEFTQRASRAGWVRVMRPVKRGENVCIKGEDIKQGSTPLKKGVVLTGPQLSICAALGREKVRVYRQPRVAVLNTGEEIVEPGNPRSAEKIYNSNGPMLSALLSAMKIKVEYLGIAPDKTQELKELVIQGLQKDILLLSGGVSMGEFDLVPAVLKECGVKEVFHKVNIKPGKPLFFGTREGCLIFGVPGNPVSTYLTFLILIKPAIRKMQGELAHLNVHQALLKEDFRQRPGRRRHFVPAKVWLQKGQLCVCPVKGYHGSADILSLSLANAFMMLEGERSLFKKDSLVEVILCQLPG